jgi:hypothetical protein
LRRGFSASEWADRIDFVVIDNETGQNVTRVLLA